MKAHRARARPLKAPPVKARTARAAAVTVLPVTVLPVTVAPVTGGRPAAGAPRRGDALVPLGPRCGGTARRGAARARLSRARTLVVRLRGAGPLAVADPHGALAPQGRAGRLDRRHRVHRRGAPLAGAEPPRLHRAVGRPAGAALGSLGATGVPAARRVSFRVACRRRRGRRALRVADDRAGPVLGRAGRTLGAARRESVGGRSRPAGRLGGRGVAGESAGARGEHRCGVAGRRPRGPYDRRRPAGGVRPVRRGDVGLGAPAHGHRHGQDRRRAAGRRGGTGKRRAPLRPGRGADPFAGGPGRGPGGVGGEQYRCGCVGAPGDRAAAGGAVPPGRRGSAGQCGRPADGRLGAVGDLQVGGADGPRRADRGPLRQDASGPVRRVRTGPLPAGVGHVRGQSGGRGPAARRPPGGDDPAGRGAGTADRSAGLLRVGFPRHEPQAGARRCAGDRRAVRHLDVPGQLGPGPACLAGGAAGRRERPPDGPCDAHRDQCGVRAPGERVGRPLGTDASAAEVFDLPLARGSTLYGRLGDWPVYGALAALAVLCAVEGLRALRRPAPGPPGPPARTAHGSPGRPGR